MATAPYGVLSVSGGLTNGAPATAYTVADLFAFVKENVPDFSSSSCHFPLPQSPCRSLPAAQSLHFLANRVYCPQKQLLLACRLLPFAVTSQMCRGCFVRLQQDQNHSRPPLPKAARRPPRRSPVPRPLARCAGHPAAGSRQAQRHHKKTSRNFRPWYCFFPPRCVYWL